MKEEILTLLSDENYIERSIDLIAKKINCTSSDKFIKLVKLMNELEETGVVVRNKYNHYYLPNQFGMVLGTLTINKKGFGFVAVEDQEKDIFIAPDSLKDAFNKDIVLVEINKYSEVERPEGKIIRVIKRGQTKLVGEIKKVNVIIMLMLMILNLISEFMLIMLICMVLCQVIKYWLKLRYINLY